jgi:Sjoegren syndrome nuclear autoantigen 1
MNQITPSTLQTFNNELVKGVETLRENHYKVTQTLLKQTEEKQELERQIKELNDKLSVLNNDMEVKKKQKCDYEKVIEDTECAYLRIVENSQSLLEKLNKETKEFR